MSFSENLRNIREERGISQKMLSIKLGISQSSVSDWESGRKLPPTKTIIRIADVLSTSTDYLLDRETDEVKQKKGVRIPVIGSIRAGIPLNAISEYEDWEEIPEHMSVSGEYVGLRVKGNSMAPRILDGDVAIIRIQDTAQTGDICAVFVNGDEATLKKIQRLPSGINLIPFNTSEFDQVFYSNEQVEELPVRIFGKLVEIRRKF